MNEIREVHTYEDSTSTTTMGILVIAILALIGIGLAFWQPWAPAASNTTIIDRQSPDTTIVNPPAVNPPSNTTIINPPAEKVDPPSKTEININGGSGGGSSDPTGTTGGN